MFGGKGKGREGERRREKHPSPGEGEGRERRGKDRVGEESGEERRKEESPPSPWGETLEVGRAEPPTWGRGEKREHFPKRGRRNRGRRGERQKSEGAGREEMRDPHLERGGRGVGRAPPPSSSKSTKVKNVHLNQTKHLQTPRLIATDYHLHIIDLATELWSCLMSSASTRYCRP